MNEGRLKYNLILIGSLISILLSRLYVYEGGPLGVYIYGTELHHIYYGIMILWVSWLVLIITDGLGWDILDHLISLSVGIGLGFISDEINFIFYWRHYTLSDYHSVVNIGADIVLILFLIILYLSPRLSTDSREEDIS